MSEDTHDPPSPILNVCTHEWRSPRKEVPDSVPVRHICMRSPAKHQGVHICTCGAVTTYAP